MLRPLVLIIRTKLGSTCPKLMRQAMNPTGEKLSINDENSTVWKLQNFTATIFLAKIPWNRLCAKELYSKLIWRKKFVWQWIFRFSTLYVTLWKNEKFCLARRKKISPNQVISFVNTILSRNFCQECVGKSNYRNLHTLHMLCHNMKSFIVKLSVSSSLFPRNIFQMIEISRFSIQHCNNFFN